MKHSKSSTVFRSQRVPVLEFEDQQLTSFAGLVVFQRLFEVLGLARRLKGCFEHGTVRPIFGVHRIVLVLIVHFLLGYRRLRETRFYADDPIVQRATGLKRLPDVATISRALSSVDRLGVTRLQALVRELVVDRLVALRPARVTLDFDGSVLSTGRFAEGTAVGFNRKKKGQRSYYPLYATVAQTGQVFDVLHRSGNVHDSNGADAFISQCIQTLRSAVPGSQIETRMDSAFFSERILATLDELGTEYTISVPFTRLLGLKDKVEARRRWRRAGPGLEYFECQWKPERWARRQRFVVIRKAVRIQAKGPVQLDLFEPHRTGYEFKVIVTNQSIRAGALAAFHEGRGSQEGLFAELKSDNAMGYVPTRTWNGNRVYLLAALLSHNLNRELQMQVEPPQRSTSRKRRALWVFSSIDSIRKRIIQRAGRLIRPRGKLTLSMGANESVKVELLHTLGVLSEAA